MYIQSIELNGKKIDRNYITHKEITQGGTLIFTMGKSPKKDKSTMALSSEMFN
jgi:putative alpha-1,2-mannosidase